MARKTVIRALLNYLPVAVELRDAIHLDAVEATSSDTRPIDYGTTFDIPDNVDGVTGEIDQMTVIDVDDNNTPDAGEVPPGAEQPKRGTKDGGAE